MENRFVTDELEKQLDNYSCFIIVGPIRCGKTSVLNELNEKYHGTMISLINDIEKVQKNPIGILEHANQYLFLDDIEYAPFLIPFIKLHLELKKDRKVIMTCSNVEMYLALSKLLPDALYLRMTYPSSFELEDKKNESIVSIIENEKQNIVDNNKIFSKMFFGCNPENIGVDLNQQGKNYLRYINALIKEKIQKNDDSIDKLKFVDFLSTIAEHVGQGLDIAVVAENVGISYNEAKYYLHILQTTGIIFYARPYLNCDNKRKSFRTKVYFYDTGLMIFITCKGDYNIFYHSDMKFKALENYIVSEFEKSYMYSNEKYSLYYYYDEYSRYDLIVKTEKETYSVGIIPSQKPNLKPFMKNRLFEHKKVIINKNYIFCLCDNVEKIKDGDILLTKVPFGVL